MNVTVHHDGYQWVAVPDSGGTTAAKRLEQLPARIVEVVELMTGTTINTDDINMTFDVPGAELAEQARHARQTATAAASTAATITADAVHTLRDQGFSLRDVATMVGVSHQRVQQLAGR